MVKGVTDGHTKKLELRGLVIVQLLREILDISAGFSHNIIYIPKELKVSAETEKGRLLLLLYLV